MKNYGRESVNGACLPCRPPARPPARGTTIPRSLKGCGVKMKSKWWISVAEIAHISYSILISLNIQRSQKSFKCNRNYLEIIELLIYQNLIFLCHIYISRITVSLIDFSLIFCYSCLLFNHTFLMEIEYYKDNLAALVFKSAFPHFTTRDNVVVCQEFYCSQSIRSCLGRLHEGFILSHVLNIFCDNTLGPDKIAGSFKYFFFKFNILMLIS